MTDPIWDVLDECMGPTRTKSERGRRGKAVRELKEAGATPDEVRSTIDWCSRRFTTFTEMALLNHLSAATAQQAPAHVDAFLNRVLGERGSE